MSTQILFYKVIEKGTKKLKFFTILETLILQSHADSIAYVIAPGESSEYRDIFSNLIYSIVKSAQTSENDYTQDIVLNDVLGNKYHLIIIKK